MTKLKDFISHARNKNMDHATIRMLLLSEGWKERDIARALTEEGLDMPIPTPPEAGARDAFLYLLTFAALYTTIISTIILAFQYINRLFPDAAFQSVYYEQSLSPIRSGMAAIIVAFPLFLFLSRLLCKEVKQHAEKRESAIRKWLTYLTLLVASVAIFTDIITLIFRLLEGELSVRFLLKVVVILVITGLTFTYYLLSLRTSSKQSSRTSFNRIFAGVASMIVFSTLIWGFVLVGSPVTGRMEKLDERRLEDLQTIENEIRQITNPIFDKGELIRIDPLPQNLREVVEQARMREPSINDPKTNEPYSYQVINNTNFELCANFDQERNVRSDVSWNHVAGLHCFTFDLTNDRMWGHTPQPILIEKEF